MVNQCFLCIPGEFPRSCRFAEISKPPPLLKSKTMKKYTKSPEGVGCNPY